MGEEVQYHTAAQLRAGWEEIPPDERTTFDGYCEQMVELGIVSDDVATEALGIYDTRNLMYLASPDTDTEDPRTWDDTVAIRIYRAPRTSIDSESNIGVEADRLFRDVLGRGYSDEVAERAAARHARFFEPQYSAVVTATIHGYSQSDWWDVVGYGPSEEEVKGAINTFAQWLRNDVWTVTVCETVVCDFGETHREVIESLSGIYADSEEEAITYFREQESRGGE